MEHCKYIIIEKNALELPIVFSPCMSHDYFSGLCVNIISAGFASFGTTKEGRASVCAFGESTTLKIKSRPEEDTNLLRRHILGISPFWND